MLQKMNFSRCLQNTFIIYGTKVSAMKDKTNELMVQYGKIISHHADGTLRLFDVTRTIADLLLEKLPQGVMSTKKKITIELVPDMLENAFEIRIIYNAPNMFDTLTLKQKAKGTLQGIRAAKRADRLAKINKWFG